MSTELIQGDGFRIDVQWRGDHLRAYVHDGVDSVEVSIAIWKILAEQCRNHGTARLLVIEDLDASVQPAQTADIIEAMVRFGFQDIRLAFVDLRDDILTNEYGETLALEHGIIGRVLRDEGDARRWLLYGSD